MRFRSNLIIFTVIFCITFNYLSQGNTCQTALSLGSLPTPAGCGGPTGTGLGATITHNGTNVGATAANPYTYIPDCGTGTTDMATGALDVWYSFVATGHTLVLNMTGTLASPNIGVYSGNCSSLSGISCTIGTTAGAVTNFIVEPLTLGQTYYIQISGNNSTATGNYTLTLNNNNDCNDCLQNATLSVSPLPVNGTYAAGQSVTFCYKITDYTQVSSNWLHGVQVSWGAGWATTTSNVVTTAPASCSGSGSWAWYPTGIGTVNSTSWGSGFYYDYSSGAAGPANNYGDYNAQNCDPQFCFTLITDPISACVSGTPLSVTVNTSGDGESGSWTSLACQDDPGTTFEAILSCCLPPTMTSTPVTCFGGTNGTVTGTLASTSAGPWDYIWLDANGVEISNVQNSTATSSSLSNLPVGTYTLLVTDNTGCVASNNVIVAQGPGITMTDPTNQILCTGSSTNSLNFIATDPLATFSWVNDNTTIGLSANGTGNISSFVATNTSTVNDTATITVIPTSSSGCPGIPQTFSIIVKPAPQINLTGDTILCSGENTSLVAAFTPAPVSNQVTFNNSALGDIPNGCNGNNCTVLPGFTSVTSTGIQPNNLISGQIVSICFTIKHKNANDLTQLTFSANGVTYTSDNPAIAPQIYNADLAALLVQIKAAPSNIPTQFCLPQSFLSLLESTGGLTNTTWQVGIKDPVKLGNNTGDFLDITVVLNNYPTASYVWSPTIGLNGTTSGLTTSSPISIQATPNSTTTYTVSITGANGCIGSESISLNVFTTIYPQFSQIGPLCQNATAPTLSSISNNGISGVWTPSVISTTTTGNTTYSFVANPNQCAVDTSMIVNVTTSITPTFNPFGPYCQNSSPDPLPTTSTNGISGTWTPSVISTSNLGSSNYIFTSDPNQCAGNNSITVSITTIQEPTFSAIGPFCQNASPTSLPLTSSNGIVGTWNPATISTNSAGSLMYIFTPNPSICADTASKVIIINPTVIPTFTQVGPLCQNSSSVTLLTNSTNGITGTWNPTTVSTTSAGSGNFSFSPNAGQCASQTQMSVVIQALPQFSVVVNAQPSICNANDGSLLISGLSANSSFTLTYSDGLTVVGPLSLTTDNIGNYLINGLNAGTYSNFSILVNGCSNTQNGPFILVDPNAPLLIITNPNQVCSPGTVDISDSTVTAGSSNVSTITYWADANGTVPLVNPNAIATSGTFYIQAENNGCTSIDSVIVSIVQTPVINLLPDTSTCVTFNLPTITGQNLTGNEAFYTNSQSNGGVVISGPVTSSQTVYMYDAFGTCSDEESFGVTINPEPTIVSFTGGTTYCQGDVITDLIATVNGTPDYTLYYSINGTNQTPLNSSNTTFNLGSTAGVYQLDSLEDANCINNSLSSAQTITINPIPGAPNAGTDTTYCSNAIPVNLTVTGSGTFTWFDENNIYLGTGPTYTPNISSGTSTYNVSQNVNGCEGPTASVVIIVEDCGIIVPTAFTPDSDNSNDFWVLENIDQIYPNNVVTIFNRWGNQIFQSKAGQYELNPWDGTYNNEKMPVGSYYFIIEYNDNYTQNLSGIVTLIKN